MEQGEVVIPDNPGEALHRMMYRAKAGDDPESRIFE